MGRVRETKYGVDEGWVRGKGKRGEIRGQREEVRVIKGR